MLYITFICHVYSIFIAYVHVNGDFEFNLTSEILNTRIALLWCDLTSEILNLFHPTRPFTSVNVIHTFFTLRTSQQQQSCILYSAGWTVQLSDEWECQAEMTAHAAYRLKATHQLSSVVRRPGFDNKLNQQIIV